MDKHVSQEVVLTYRSAPPQEVVLTYRAPAEKPRGLVPCWVMPKKPKSKYKGLWVFLGCAVVLGLLMGGIFLWMHLTHVPFTMTEIISTEITIPVYDTQGDGEVMALSMDQSQELTPQEIYALVNPAVVTVLCEINGTEMSMGTGVIYSQDGYIVTNYHVVEGASSCAVALSTGEVLQAYYIAGDEDYDLAVLKVNGEGLATAEFGESDLLTVGDPVYAIGNPLGLELRGTFTDGMVSAINRDVEVDGRTMSTLIQTNAALNSGNSGGPLVNVYGQVVGINTVKMGSGSTSVEGIGFAIPSSTVQRIVQDLVTVGEVQPEPLFGITVGSIGTELPDGTLGAMIYEVTEDAPAGEAGLQEGDVMVSVDHTLVENSSDVLRVRRQLRVGDTVEVVFWRNDRLMSVDMELTMW